MAKQFRGNQVARDGCTVYAYKAREERRDPPMDRTRNKFLARSGLPGDQHVASVGAPLDTRVYFLQGARTPDDLVDIAAYCLLRAE